jgi:nucleoside-diphosphate kinase
MIKPEAKSFIGEIIEILEKNRLYIKKLKMLKLQPLQAVQFCSEKSSEDEISQLMDNITSGSVVVLEVLGENANEEMKKICGPLDLSLDEVKKNYPASLRAKFGLDNIKCAVLYSKDPLTNQKDLEFFFSKSKNDKFRVNAKFHRSTLCLIKPHAVKDGKIGSIIKMITDNGYSILSMKIIHLTRNQCEEFYEIYKGVVGEYLQMVNQLQSGACLALEIQGIDEDVHAKFRAFCGPADPKVAKIVRPHTLRALFGIDKVLNAIHCTDLREDNQLELEYIFTKIE